MYALRPVKDSCAPVADQMSCAAMTSLAIREAQQNRLYLDTLVRHPACQRFQEILNTDDEHRLIKTGGAILQKNVCVVKTPEYQQGPWSDVFGQALTPASDSLASVFPSYCTPHEYTHATGNGTIPARFEAWTRAKGYRETI